jgi:transcriptional regulator with XRE-family HTH domain
MTPEERSRRVFEAIRKDGLRAASTSPLRRARLEAGLTLRELAARSLVSPGHIALLERTASPPLARTRLALVTALGRPESVLWPELDR